MVYWLIWRDDIMEQYVLHESLWGLLYFLRPTFWFKKVGFKILTWNSKKHNSKHKGIEYYFSVNYVIFE